MDLFGPTPSHNLLPRDGIVNYHGPVFKASEAQRHFNALLHGIQWRNDETVIFGKRIVTTRKVAWYGDEPFAYTYSGSTKHALPWTQELRELKACVEEISRETFNSCLLNLYHDGNEGMGWHSDDERMIGRHSAIGSISFGAERKFAFKHKTKQGVTAALILEHGSLLVMKGSTQTHWLHCLPKSKRIITPRINLTFRTIVDQSKHP